MKQRYNIITESVFNGNVITDNIIQDVSLEAYTEMLEKTKTLNKNFISNIQTNDDGSMVNIEYITGLLHVFMLVPVGVTDKRTVKA